MVDRLCQIMDEDIETDILNEALLSVVRKCGNLEELINAAVVGIDRGSSYLRMERRYHSESTSSTGSAKGSAPISNIEVRDGVCADQLGIIHRANG